MIKVIGLVASLACLSTEAVAQTAFSGTVNATQSVSARDTIGKACEYFQIGATWYAIDATDASYAAMVAKADRAQLLGLSTPVSGKYIAAVSGVCDGATKLVTELTLGTPQ